MSSARRELYQVGVALLVLESQIVWLGCLVVQSLVPRAAGAAMTLAVSASVVLAAILCLG